MKLSYLPILLVALFFMVACKDDPVLSDELTYAGENADSPLLPSGTYSTAVKFPASITSDHVGKFLEEVEYRLYDVPTSIILTIYGQGSNTEPGSIIYTKNLSNVAAANVINTAFLSPPIEISEEDLWISFEFTHDVEQKTMGCDGGPAKSDGDWFFDEFQPGWEKFSSFSSDINWNITGLLSE